MRDVAVTEGDKVEAQLRFGVSVNTYGVNDLVAVVDAVDGRQDRPNWSRSTRTATGSTRRTARGRRAARVAALRRADRTRPARFPHRGRIPRVHHELRGSRRPAPAAGAGRAAADGRRLRLRRRGRLEDLGAAAHAQGRWAPGRSGGTSFMEDYTYHLEPGREVILGAHMLEVCPIASPRTRPRCEIHPLGIGGREDPVRLVFDAAPGRPSSSASPTWATDSAWSPTRSTSSPPLEPLPAPAGRPRGLGAAAQPARRPPSPGSPRAPRTTLCFPRPWTAKNSPTWPTCSASNCSSSTTTPRPRTSPRNSAGTRRTTACPRLLKQLLKHREQRQ